MRKVLGLIIALVAFAVGFYVGISIFISGIKDIVHAFDVDPVNGGKLGWGIIEAFVLASPVGVIVGWIIGFLAFLLAGIHNEEN